MEVEMRTLLVLLVLVSAGCGAVVEPPPPCTVERAVWVQWDDRGRPVMFSCDWPRARAGR